MVYGRYNYSIHGFINQLITEGAPSCTFDLFWDAYLPLAYPGDPWVIFVKATRSAPFYKGECAAVACPANSAGNVAWRWEDAGSLRISISEIIVINRD